MASTPVRHLQLVNVHPDKREEYLRLHAEVWPAVEARISASNITNYSIFIQGELLIAYFEYVGSDYEADMALIAADPTTQAWWALTGPCQVPIADALPDTLWTDAHEAWHLN